MTNVFITKEVDMDDPLYQQERKLRNDVLLRPIGIEDFGWEHNDKNSTHIVMVLNELVVGCVLLRAHDEQGQLIAQLSQMAVADDYQRKGIGNELIEYLLEYADSKKIKKVYCHARDEAVEFYRKNGFKSVGEPYVEVGVKHINMEIAVTCSEISY
jgi:predicted GNAT family N-acyltransferase